MADGRGGVWMLQGSWDPSFAHITGNKITFTVAPRPADHDVNLNALAYVPGTRTVWSAGASTVTEIAAVGAAALFVPFPHAVDDHQTTNARFLVEAGGAWLVPQTELTAQSLAERLRSVNRAQLMEMATKAKQMEKTQAVAAVVTACEQLAKVKAS